MIPDYFEALTAYRAWAVHSNGLLLGQAFPEPWPPHQPFVGRCGKAYHTHLVGGVFSPPPITLCDCGIHAYKTIEQARDRTTDTAHFRYGFYPSVGVDTVWGSLKLWGRIIEHERGYRAEFAYPEVLYCHEEKLSKTIAKVYGVPCHYVERPKSEENLYDEGYMFFGGVRGSRIFNTGPISFSPSIKQLVSHMSFDPAKVIKNPPMVQPATLAQIQTLQATPWQKQQASMKARQKGILAVGNWQEKWRRAFYVNKTVTPNPFGIL